MFCAVSAVLKEGSVQEQFFVKGESGSFAQPNAPTTFNKLRRLLSRGEGCIEECIGADAGNSPGHRSLGAL